jgi:hypothetical protein
VRRRRGGQGGGRFPGTGPAIPPVPDLSVGPAEAATDRRGTARWAPSVSVRSHAPTLPTTTVEPPVADTIGPIAVIVTTASMVPCRPRRPPVTPSPDHDPGVSQRMVRKVPGAPDALARGAPHRTVDVHAPAGVAVPIHGVSRGANGFRSGRAEHGSEADAIGVHALPRCHTQRSVCLTGNHPPMGTPSGHTDRSAAIPTTGVATPWPTREPWNEASPKAKIPPSEAASQ